jgi:hypothetical protein
MEMNLLPGAEVYIVTKRMVLVQDTRSIHQLALVGQGILARDLAMEEAGGDQAKQAQEGGHELWNGFLARAHNDHEARLWM